jgi:hypothetical protein
MAFANSGSTSESYLVDGVSAVAIHNGVARIQFMRLNVEGKPESAVELAVPVTQVKSIVEAFMKAQRT